MEAWVVAGRPLFFSFLLFFLFSPYPFLPRVRCVHTQKRRCNRFSTRFGFIGSRPFHLVPFSSFPFPHTCSPLLLHVLLSSCPGISFLIFFLRTHWSRALTQVLGRPGLIMRWGSLFAPLHLVPSHRNHVHFCPVLPSFHVFILLSVQRARVHICLRLSSSLSLGEACVCVCVCV